MAEWKLDAALPLEGARFEQAGLVLEEVGGKALVSVALPQGGAAEADLNARLMAAYRVQMPAVGRWAAMTADRRQGAAQDQQAQQNLHGKALRLARDQLWFLLDWPDGSPAGAPDGSNVPNAPDWPNADPEQVVAAAIGAAGYVVDQSDGWAMVRLTGGPCREVLERLCPLDLHPDVFAVGHVARTVMKHLGVIIFREDDETYFLMSPRSSAPSFWHALSTSVRNVAPQSPLRVP